LAGGKGVGAAEAVGEAVADDVGSVEARMGAPHLLQNLVPGTIFVPQELQNAINHLICMRLYTFGASIPQIGGGKRAQCRLSLGADKEASQTRDYWVAKNATLRAARSDPSLRKERLFRMTIKS
jgi:hypothetical protein